MTVSRLALTVLALALAVGIDGTAAAKPWWLRGVESNDADFLPPDAAFRVAAVVDGNVLRVRWVIADGYYLYKHKIEIAAQSPDLVVSAPSLPRGIVKNDPFLGVQETYEQQVEATVAYTRFDAGAHPLELKVTYQGCAKAGLCYPPITKVIFPHPAMPAVAAASHPWEGWAILGGGIAFLSAGLLLRKGRKLDMPTA